MKAPLQTVEMNDAHGTPFALDYYILEKEVQLDGKSVCRFGLEIDKRAHRCDGSPYLEYRKIFDVFPTEAEAAAALHLLARNTVTPVTMQEVLEDLLGTASFESESFFVDVG